LKFSIQDRCAQHKRVVEGHFNALSHNVVTYNGKCITAAYLLVPQDKFVSASDKKEFVKTCIKNDPDTAADSLLTILKDLELTKNEFSVYNKLYLGTEQSSINRQRHKAHKLMQMAINVFWRDFHEKKIKINNYSYDSYVSVEFESFMAALIHLMGNMSKYTLPNGEVSITYKKTEKTLLINLAMLSLFVFPDEIERIWEEGYSGRLAKQTQKDGNGLGMNAIKKLIELNMGTFIFKPDIRIDKAVNFEGVMYANNEIIIEVPIAKR
jgi:K+-sensing histidine kinase KdpD